jgi:hypothetical protein
VGDAHGLLEFRILAALAATEFSVATARQKGPLRGVRGLRHTVSAKKYCRVSGN